VPGFGRTLGPQLQYALKGKPDAYGINKPYDIAIGCGRQAIAPLRALKKTWGEKVFTVYIQDPHINAKYFDLVIAPEHDGLRGDNVETMIGAPNRVHNDRLIVETLKFSQKLASLPAPRVAMLIGGNSKSHKLTPQIHAGHMQTIKDLIERDMSVMITSSRRTPSFAVESYREMAAQYENVWYWDGAGDNPYFAFLGGANIILVTEDSTNMLTESCATGKPVFTLPMQGRPGKFAKLYAALAERCHVRPYDGNIEAQTYPPLRETARMAEILLQRYENK